MGIFEIFTMAPESDLEDGITLVGGVLYCAAVIVSSVLTSSI